jgi:GTP-binding protein LepA
VKKLKRKNLLKIKIKFMQIRNFSIIAHIDHGKSTLSDRFLEVTKTIDPRKMTDQVLDNMELEKERGITIKMQPVRMEYEMGGGGVAPAPKANCIFNLIDTPGHIDFSYEVSRSLKAVEGAIMLVDATQGVQAQTMTVLQMAQDAGLKILPVISKIDSPLADIPKVEGELMDLLGCAREEISRVSGKTGEGVEDLLEKVYAQIPQPKVEFPDTKGGRALIFDFGYSNHQGVIVFVRVFDGKIKVGDELIFNNPQKKFVVSECGVFKPDKVKKDYLEAGEIGYIVTGIKEPGITKVGDTIISPKSLQENMSAIAGYHDARPLVFASIYPEAQEYFHDLRQALLKLKLSDSSLSFEEEASGILGRGFRCGFLGMLHLEIICERLRREHNLELIVTTPSIPYKVKLKNGEVEEIYNPMNFPDHGEYLECEEPIVQLTIICPPDYVSNVTKILYDHEGILLETDIFSADRFKLLIDMPLRELMRNFFDELKSVSSGYASISYEPKGYQKADVRKLEILLAEELVPAFTKIVGARRLDVEAKDSVEKLYNILPRELFIVKIQARSNGKIISSRSLSAMRKDVTGYLYGGDITRKMKLREKQKKGKKKMQGFAKVNVSQDTFMEMMKGGEVKERAD